MTFCFPGVCITNGFPCAYGSQYPKGRLDIELEKWDRNCLNVSFFYHVRTIKQIGVSEKSFLEGRKNVSCER